MPSVLFATASSPRRPLVSLSPQMASPEAVRSSSEFAFLVTSMEYDFHDGLLRSTENYRADGEDALNTGIRLSIAFLVLTFGVFLVAQSPPSIPISFASALAHSAPHKLNPVACPDDCSGCSPPKRATGPRTQESLSPREYVVACLVFCLLLADVVCCASPISDALPRLGLLVPLSCAVIFWQSAIYLQKEAYKTLRMLAMMPPQEANAELIPWNASLMLKIKRVDVQHKRLVDLINRVFTPAIRTTRPSLAERYHEHTITQAQAHTRAAAGQRHI